MATVQWRGGAKAVAQVNTITPANVNIGNTFTVTINSKAYTFTATAGTVANVTAGLVALLSASTEPEFAEITWTDSTTHVTATAKTAGVPFTQTSSASGGTATNTTATATASSGPEDWSVAANWSGGAVPVNSDDVYIGPSQWAIKYGLNQSGVTLTSLTVAANFTGDLGLPAVNQSGTSPYAEYRPDYLAIGATTVTIGLGVGQGSPRFKLNTGSVQTAVTVHGTGSSPETGLGAFRFKGTHASNTLTITKGNVDVAGTPGDVATVATLTVGYQTSIESDVNLRCGAGVTLTTLNQTGGTVELGAGLTTATKTAGTLTILGGNVTTVTNDDGAFVYRGAGTIGTLTGGTDSVNDFGQDMRGCTVTNCTLHKGSSLSDPYGRVTFTNPFRISRATLEEVNVNVGPNRTYQVAS